MFRHRLLLCPVWPIANAAGTAEEMASSLHFRIGRNVDSSQDVDAAARPFLTPRLRSGPDRERSSLGLPSLP